VSLRYKFCSIGGVSCVQKASHANPTCSATWLSSELILRELLLCPRRFQLYRYKHKYANQNLRPKVAVYTCAARCHVVRHTYNGLCMLVALLTVSQSELRFSTAPVVVATIRSENLKLTSYNRMFSQHSHMHGCTLCICCIAYQ
jgi:hypothetical protein